ncbi:MAG TPA: lysylphosphatidylglycerol synthase transmembrane domain-containing protein [Ktedonobacteraceae bacterium]|nr:lysylphosphatidylglycerol synthase transmembrane domain-containing protein [Ktedonobacteraceae bacterium]
MQYDPDELPPPVRPRPTRPRLVNINEERSEERRATRSPASGSDISMETTVILQPLPDEDDDPTEPRIARVRFKPLPVTGDIEHINDVHDKEDDVDDVSEQSTRHLKQLSGMMPAVKIPKESGDGVLPSPAPGVDEQEEGYWPHGIQQTGAFPVVNLYGRKPFGQTLPQTPAIVIPASSKPRSAWRVALGSPAAKIIIGLIIGVGLLFLVAHFVDLPTTIAILRHNLTTPRGIILALLSGAAFLLAFSIRGVRWKLFLNPIGKVGTFKVIQLFLVGIFLNFLLPIRGGEVAKSLMLKRTSNIPVSKSLPTVAMDKALDLMPALFIMAIVPFLGIKMDIKLWIVLALVGGLLVCLIAFIALAAWKRNAAIRLLQRMTGLLPQSIGGKIAGFATGFVDSLLAGASQPRIFVPAMLLTLVAVTFDGLFAMLAFWTIGYQISFGTAIFGYTVYNMFYILPTPPGQVGSNEAVGLLVFAGLLHLPADKVTAMFVFSHPWSALLMTVTAMICLSALGLKLSSAMKVQTEGENAPI